MKGLSAVYGFLVIYLLIMAGLGAISELSSNQASLSGALQRESGLSAAKEEEHLTLSLDNETLLVSNDGSVYSTIDYEVARSGSSNIYTRVDEGLPVGSNATLAAPASATQVGVSTELGNLFWDSSASSAPSNTCPAGATTLTTDASPTDGGTEQPEGVSTVCVGEPLSLAASSSSGFAFLGWSGSGEGAYTGPSNPATSYPLGQTTESAEFEPAVLVRSLSPSADGVSSDGPTRTASLTVFGAPQTVSFSAGPLPPGVSVSFNPQSASDSLSGIETSVTFAFAGANYGTSAVRLIATGADGQTAVVDFVLQTTPPDGAYSGGYALYPQGVGYPMEHKSIYNSGGYFLWFGSEAKGEFENAYLPTFYESGWDAGEIGYQGSSPASGFAFDLSQRSSEVLLTDSEIGSPDLCYNLGVVTSGTLSWVYGGAACGGPAFSLKYDAQGYNSGLIAADGELWAAVATIDPSGSGHIEVMASANGTGIWSEVYVSQSFGQGVTAVPQLLQLAEGGVALLYTSFTPGEGCSAGDYLLYTTNSGFSWTGPLGPFLASGSSLCYDNSSGAAIGDTVYAGGVTSAGALAYWSYDLDDGSGASGTIESEATYAAFGSVGSTLYAAYSSGSCTGGHEVSIAWSYDLGSTWQASGTLGCDSDFLVVASPSNTYQIAVESDYPSGGLYYERFIFYTV